jgi:ribosomal protein L32
MKTTQKTKDSRHKRHSQRIELKRLKAENPNICTLIEKLDLVLIKNPKQ